MKRWDLINHYIKIYGFTTFLEIGHDKGEAFENVDILLKESIDPNMKTNPTYDMSSDDFFEIYDKSYDIIFIDGLHEHTQVERDIVNSLSHLSAGGVIILHDCNPPSQECQRHSYCYPGGAWTGDCWKAFVKYRYLLDYEMYVWDHDWGCGVIDTNVSKITDTSNLPHVMALMRYDDLIMHKTDWLNLKTDIPEYERKNPS